MASTLKVIAHAIAHPASVGDIARSVQARGRDPLTERQPWWTYGAASFVAGRVGPGSRVFEYGGGGSTLWLQDRGASVTTVEHNREWYDRLHEQAPGVLYMPVGEDGTVTSEDEGGYFDDYVGAIDRFDIPFDLVIVDGRCRVACAARALDKLRDGGMLLFDDSQRPRYAAVHEMLEGWEEHRFRGVRPAVVDVTETTVWIKPPAA